MNEMNFEQFSKWARENIKFFLPEEYGKANVEIHEVTKTGSIYTGMTVRNEDQTIAPAVNLNVMFEAYKQGSPLYEIGKNMAEIVQMKHPELNTGVFKDYDSIKKNLFVRVCNNRENSEMLKTVPHKDIEDLSLTYHIMVNNGDSGIASAMVTNTVMESLGISSDQLHEDAIRSSQNLLPLRMDSMMNMLMGMTGMDMEQDTSSMMFGTPMMVITNQLGLNGASAFFYPKTMDKVSEEMKGDFYMLPSSIHEVIAVPASYSSSYRDLESMVKEINEMQVAKEEQLSDHVYHYDAREKIFELASRHEERMHGNEKKSLLGKLAEKKQEAAVLNDAAPAKHKDNERTM